MEILRAISIPAVLLSLSFAMTDDSSADTLRYRLSGDWTEVTDGITPGWGVNPNNDGSPGVAPGAADEARINWGNNTVTVTTTVPTVDRILIAVDESGIIDINSGGTLTTGQDTIVGNNGFAEATLNVNSGGTLDVGRILWVGKGDSNSGDFPGDTLGTLNLNAGGVVNVASHLWWGALGEAVVNISGTLNQTAGILGLGTSDALTHTGGFATVNVLNGGSFNLNNIDGGNNPDESPRLGSIQTGSKIDIQGTGQVTILGDLVGAVGEYRDANLLFGNGVAGAVDIALGTAGSADGDYNGDGVVDAADYTVWRDNLGGDSSALNGNGSGAGTVVQADYDLWTGNFGASAPLITIVTATPLPATAVSVPEPGSITLLALLASVGLPGVGRSRK